MFDQIQAGFARIKSACAQLFGVIWSVFCNANRFLAYLASPESSSFVCAILCHMIIVAIFLAALVTALVIGEIATGNQGANHPEATLEYLLRRGDESPTSATILINSVTWGAVTALTFVLRVICVVWVNREWGAEDFAMVFTTLCYVSLLFSIAVSSTHQTNLYPKFQEAAILANRPEVASRIYGSKLVVAVEQLMLCTIWGTKLSVGLFIRRMVIGHTRYQRAVYATMTYIGVSFVALEAVYFSLCRPFSGYWMLPVPDEQCATLTKYTILQACLNITSDLALLVIPVHVIWRQQYFRNGPLQRKLVRVALFGSVGFTIVAAILGKIFNWTNLYTTTYLVWYIIEASVATMVGNLISVWKLVKKILETTAYERRVTWEKTKNLGRNLRYSCSYALSKIKMPKMSRQSRRSGTNLNGPSPFSAQRASNTRAPALYPRTERVYLPPRKVGLPFGQSSEYLFSHASRSPGGRSQRSLGGLSLEERYELHMF